MKVARESSHGLGDRARTAAMIQLLCELNAGIRSAEENGWISEEDFRSRLRRRGSAKSAL